MSYEKEIPKNGKYNEFVSHGDKDKTHYTVLDGTDLADVFINREKIDIEKGNANNSKNRKEFITGINIEKTENNIEIVYTTDTTFPNCITDGHPNCDNCPSVVQQGSNAVYGSTTRFLTDMNITQTGHTYSINTTSALNYGNCPTNGSTTYCTHCTHCTYCQCTHLWCKAAYCNCYCYCKCAYTGCASDGCGP